MADRTHVKLRRSTAMAHDGAKLLERDGIAKGLPIMAEKRAPGQFSDGNDDHVILRTNVYGLAQKPMTIYRYDLTITGHLQNGKTVEITKKVGKDAINVDRRLMCRAIMTAFKEQYSDFLQSKKNHIYYDLQSLLYSIFPLQINDENGATFPIAADSVNIRSFSCVKFEVTIKRLSGEAESLDLTDFSNVNENVKEVDKSIEQFLNLATSQSVMFNKEDFISFSSSSIYHLNPQAYGFKDTDSPFFEDNGSYLGIGIQKGVHPIEGPRGGAALGLVISTKKTPFHAMETVLQKACRFFPNTSNVFNNRLSNNDRGRLSAQLKGIMVETTYGSRQRFSISDVSSESAISKRFTIEDTERRGVTVQSYFNEKYNITLEYPNAPLIISTHQQKSNAFPMELCVICDNQRVKVQAQTPKQVQAMIKLCAVNPSLHVEQNMYSKKALALDEDEGLLKAKFRVVPTTLNVAARHLRPPQLEYKDAFVAMVRRDSFSWNGRMYLVPANCEKWAAYVFQSGASPKDNINEADFRKFVGRFMAEAEKNGLRLTNPIDIRFCDCTEQELNHEFRLASDNGCQFMLMVHPDRNDDLHPAIKYNERLYEVVTQCLNVSTVKNVVTKGQPLTLLNITNKTNIKLGGINYSLSFKDDAMSKEVLGTKTLYIGFGMNHPPPSDQRTNAAPPNGSNGNGSDGSNGNSSSLSDLILPNTTPSVVGYCANIGINNNFEFIGDFVYQEPKRDEKMLVIRSVINRCIGDFRKNRRTEPERLVIFRNGCAEGQYGGILEYEIPLIRHELIHLECAAKVSLIVSNKRQNIRFFRGEINPHAKATEQNIRPGTVVDSCVVHPFFSEYYLNSHRALQGTARTPRYTLLYDENDMSMDLLQGMTNYLCYGHQIVNLPTSLPSPVYIAIRYAERGQMLYRKMRERATADSDPRTYTELTNRLAFNLVEGFRNRRINA